MKFRKLFSITMLLLSGSLYCGPLALAADTQPTGKQNWKLPRTADGHADLQGVWNFSSKIPMQRTTPIGKDEALSAKDIAEFEQLLSEAQKNQKTAPANAVGGYNDFWLDFKSDVTQDARHSLITDPPYGRIPPLAATGIRQDGLLYADTPGQHPVRFQASGIGVDNPEDRGVSERCLVGFNSGPPMTPSGYNNNMQLFQTADHVVILNEMIHDARIIPLNGRPHLPDQFRHWQGDSIGHWEGDTLVVDTTNFTDKIASFNIAGLTALGTAKDLHVIERFTRVSEGRLRYEFTVDDPTTFTRPFTASMLMGKLADGQLFEYACHEGNYSLSNVLSAARAQEKTAAKQPANNK